MGDRTYCTLSVIGRVQKPHWEALLSQIKEIMGPETMVEGFMTFDEVNYGELDHDVYNLLKANKLSFIWTYEAGDAYNAGFELYNAETGQYARYCRDEEGLLLTMDEARHGFDTADRWQKWIDTSYLRGLEII